MARGRIVIFGWADSVHIARWARGLRDRGFDIQIISVGGDPLTDIPTVVFPHTGKLSYIRHAREAARYARQFTPDLIHCHYAAGFGLWTLAAKFHPTLVSVWGSDVINVSGVTRFLVRRTLNRADWISATGEFLGRAAVEILPRAKQRMTIIPFGVNRPDSPPPFPDGPIRLCFLKEHRKIYAPDILVEAFAVARRECPNLRLTLAGGGEMTEGLKRRLAELKLLDAVDFPGYFDHRNIVSFLADHHILVMPSRMESFGVAALEASSCARPVIASNVGGIPEVVIDGVTGLLVPPEDINALAGAIVRLANDSVLRMKLGSAGYQFVGERYQWEKCLDQMCDLYDRLIHDAKTNSVL